MLPGAPAVQLYACEDPAHPTCKQPAGKRCISSKGKAVPPHPKRWNLGQGYADAYNELTPQLEQAEAELAAARADLATRDTRISQLEETNAELQRRVDDLSRAPEPARSLTRFGACPRKGKNGADVVARWGKGAAVRLFCGTEVPTRPADAGVVHVSWKPSAAQITDAWVQKVCAPLVAGDCVEVWHESNKKVTDKVLSLEDVTARKNAFYDAVKRVRPDLLVMNTLTGWSLDPKSKTNLSPYMVRGDGLGVDCDGVRPSHLPYTDYQDETVRALAIVADDANGYSFFAVPEFGCPRIPTEDPDGTVRAAYHDKYADLWAASGKCLFVTLYEYDSSPNYSLTQPAEMAGWAAHI